MQLKSKLTARSVHFTAQTWGHMWIYNQNILTSAVAHGVQPGSAVDTDTLALMSDGCSTQDRGLRPGPLDLLPTEVIPTVNKTLRE